MIGLALVIVFIGRSIDNRATLHGAAESAAQAAALERSPAAARAAAQRVGAAMLGRGDSCTTPSIDVDLSRFRAGGVVAVTVSCSVDRSGVELVSPPRVRGEVTAFATIDQFRELDGQP